MEKYEIKYEAKTFDPKYEKIETPKNFDMSANITCVCPE